MKSFLPIGSRPGFFNPLINPLFTIAGGAAAQPNSEEILQNVIGEEQKQNIADVNEAIYQTQIQSLPASNRIVQVTPTGEQRQQQIDSLRERAVRDALMLPQGEQLSVEQQQRLNDAIQQVQAPEEEADENAPLLPEQEIDVDVASPIIQRPPLPAWLQEQIIQIEQQNIDDVALEERDGYRTWRQAILTEIRNTPNLQKAQIITTLLKNTYDLYLLWKERQTFDPPTEKPIIDPPRDREDNVKFLEETSKRALPSQCKRVYRLDAKGVMRSVVICDSMGSQRIYFDK